jgi:hypothetical protein
MKNHSRVNWSTAQMRPYANIIVGGVMICDDQCSKTGSGSQVGIGISRPESGSGLEIST